MEALRREQMCDTTELIMFDMLQELKEIKKLLQREAEPAVSERESEDKKEMVKAEPAKEKQNNHVSNPKKQKPAAKKGRVK